MGGGSSKMKEPRPAKPSNEDPPTAAPQTPAPNAASTPAVSCTAAQAAPPAPGLAAPPMPPVLDAVIHTKGQTMLTAPPVVSEASVGSPPASMWLESEAKVIYVSDVEGHWEYFCNFVVLVAPRLRFRKPPGLEPGGGTHHGSDQKPNDLEAHKRDPRPPDLELEDGWHFVYGGDSCDKGLGSLRFIEAMVKLKMSYPDRVWLLLGNRDINKMRWTSELDPAELKRAKDVPAAYWLPENQRKTYAEFLMKVAKPERSSSKASARSAAATDKKAEKAFVTDEMFDQRNTLAAKAKYHLITDMGSNTDFEFRREELALVHGRQANSVSDDEVVASYLAQVEEGGMMREYLKHGDLVLLLAGTVYVHGQIIGNQFTSCEKGCTHWAVKVVPKLSSTYALDGRIEVDEVSDLEEWARRLNSWAKDEVNAWIRQPKWFRPPTEPTLASWAGRGGSALIAYGTPATPVPSVVYCRWLTCACMPLCYPDDLVQYLTANGVKRVIVGHTPHGHCPTVIHHNHLQKDLLVIMADTSFSQMNANTAFHGDNRGNAVCAVLLENNVIRVKGYTHLKDIIDYKIGGIEGDPYVGYVNGKEFFVKAKVFGHANSDGRTNLNESQYLLCSIDGYKHAYKALCSDEAAQTLGSLSGFKRDDSWLSVITSHGDIFGHDFGEGNGNEALLRYIWNRLDRDGDGELKREEVLSACTDQLVRDALSCAFPDCSLDTIVEELSRSNEDVSFDITHMSAYFHGESNSLLPELSDTSRRLLDGIRQVRSMRMGTQESTSLVPDV